MNQTALVQGAEGAFGNMLRHWRQTQRLSQLELAMEADVSSKHVSFLETGRNKPSREMILRLGNAMALTLRQQNMLLNAAGYAAVFSEGRLDSPQLSQVKEALERILAQHEPYPAVVMDRNWNLLQQNRGASALVGHFLDQAPAAALNLMELVFAPDGLQPYVKNWPLLGSTLLMRVHRDSLSNVGDEAALKLFEKLCAMPTVPDNWRELAVTVPDTPTVDLELHKGSIRCRFFTAISTLGTPQDITLQELRIESFFPSDEHTAKLCASWADMT